jgi:GT2 family glycosyltransferase
MGDALSRHDFVACRIDVEKLNPSWVVEVMGRPQHHDLQEIWYPPYLPHAGGGTLGVKKALHAAVGGFDEEFPYLHDTDFCFKAQRAGATFHFVRDAVIHVRFRHGVRGMYRQALNWAAYNVKLYKRYQLTTGMSVRNPWSLYFACWWRVARRLRRLPHKQGRATLMKGMGWQIGLLQGSLKYRVAPVASKWAC